MANPQVLEAEHRHLLRRGRDQRDGTASAVGGAPATLGRTPMRTAQRRMPPRGTDTSVLTSNEGVGIRVDLISRKGQRIC